MEDKLVSFEVATLAKEKGFNWKCDKAFQVGSLVVVSEINHQWECRCPTQSHLQKWLRDVHEIDITIMILVASDYKVYVHQKRNIVNSRGITIHPEQGKYTFETALDAGLLFSLNLL